MGLKMIHDNVLIKQDGQVDKTKGGIVLSATSKTNSTVGTVISVGSGIYQNGVFVPTTVKVGDKVVFSKSAAEGSEKIEENGEELIIMKEEHIFGTDQ